LQRAASIFSSEFRSPYNALGSITRLTSAPFRVTPSGAIWRVMFSPCLSACQRSLLESSCTRCGVSPLLRWDYWLAPDRNGVITFRIGKLHRASGPSLRREPGTVSAKPLTFANPHCSDKDVSTTFVPFCVTTLPPRLHLHSTRFQFLLA
jgi:hypothetical protein